jgi:outer membrane murein-binding lipoprotein Lpp
MLVSQRKRLLVLGAVLVSALLLAGCTSQIADLPLVGTPTDAPVRPKEQGAYLPVNDLPPARDEAAMDVKERAKIQAELMAARDRQAVVTPAKDAGATAK